MASLKNRRIRAPSIPSLSVRDVFSDAFCPHNKFPKTIKAKSWGHECFHIHDAEALSNFCQANKTSHKNIPNFYESLFKCGRVSWEKFWEYIFSSQQRKQLKRKTKNKNKLANRRFQERKQNEWPEERIKFGRRVKDLADDKPFLDF